MENKIKLYNRADGVDGHYCVGRDRGGWSEYWTGKKFSGFGKLYTSESQAQEIADLLQASLQCAELKKEVERMSEENRKLEECLLSSRQFREKAEAENESLKKLLEKVKNASMFLFGKAQYDGMALAKEIEEALNPSEDQQP